MNKVPPKVDTRKTITYDSKLKWYAHPVAFVLFFFTKNTFRPWMFNIDGKEKARKSK